MLMVAGKALPLRRDPPLPDGNAVFQLVNEMGQGLNGLGAVGGADGDPQGGVPYRHLADAVETVEDVKGEFGGGLLGHRLELLFGHAAIGLVVQGHDGAAIFGGPDPAVEDELRAGFTVPRDNRVIQGRKGAVDDAGGDHGRSRTFRHLSRPGPGG